MKSNASQEACSLISQFLFLPFCESVCELQALSSRQNWFVIKVLRKAFPVPKKHTIKDEMRSGGETPRMLNLGASRSGHINTPKRTARHLFDRILGESRGRSGL